MPGCGKINLTGAAKFPLRIFTSLPAPEMAVETRSKLQEIINPESRTASGGMSEGVRRHEVGQIGGQ
jgi:hypothetical protein